MTAAYPLTLTFDAQGKWPTLIMCNGDSLCYPLFDHTYSLLPTLTRKSIVRIWAVMNPYDNGADLTRSVAYIQISQPVVPSSLLT